jgi:hypothetical protein
MSAVQKTGIANEDEGKLRTRSISRRALPIRLPANCGYVPLIDALAAFFTLCFVSS